jgi:hypothetical protein
MHEAGLAGGQFDPQHRMHHHDHDDADALGIIDPVDAAARGAGGVWRMPLSVIAVLFRRGKGA